MVPMCIWHCLFSEPVENLLKIQIATTTFVASIIVQDVRPPMHGALVKSTPSTKPSRPTSAKTLTPITNTQAHTQIHVKYNEMIMRSTPSTEPPRPTSAAVLLSWLEAKLSSWQRVFVVSH